MNDLDGEDFADNEEIDGTPEAYHAEVSTSPVNMTTLGDEYDYDVEANLNSFFWDELLPTLIVYSLTFILGLVGNILIIFTTFRYRKMKSTTNVFLASLASADLLLIVFCIPVKESTISLSDNENSPMKVNSTECTDTPKELPKKLALFNLPDVLDEIFSGEQKIDEIKKSQDPHNSDYSTHAVLMNFLGKDYLKIFELEELMAKLKTLLSSGSEVPETKNFHERIPKLLTTDDGFRGRIFPSPTAVYPVSAARSQQAGGKSYRTEEGNEPRYASSRCVRQSRERLRKDANTGKGLLRDIGPLIMSSAVVQNTPSSTKTKSFSNSPDYIQDSLEGSKPGENAQSSGVSSVSGRTEEGPGKNESQRRFEVKILKLDNKLKEMLRRISVCPTKDQVTIKKCLERMRESAGAVLRRLRTDRFDSCHRYCGGYGDTVGSTREDNQFKTEPPVKVKDNTQQVTLRTNESEIQLNLGMEITMENFDPVTGQKLPPEQNREFEQKGNIQCKLVKPGEDPIPFIYTDFMYNPKTGMLFQNDQTASRNQKRRENASVKSTKTYLLSRTTQSSFPGNADSDSSHRKPELQKSKRTSENLTYRERDSSPDSSKSVLADAFRLAVEREEMKNAKHLKDGRHTSRSFPREKPRRIEKQCSHGVISLVPIVTSCRNKGYNEANSKNKRKQDLHEKSQGNRGNVYFMKKEAQTVILSDKGAQANLARSKTLSESVERRSTGIQARVKEGGKILVNRAADTTFLGTPLWALKRGMNVCVQTSSTELLPGLRRSSDVSSQTDFLIEEAQKYMKDLEAQKRVNLAIAELCYHLSNGTDVIDAV